MGRRSQGESKKLSIKLSYEADQKIDKVCKNVNLSKAGAILFALSDKLNEDPSKEDILNLENKIQLQDQYFSVTIKVNLDEKLNSLVKDYDLKKGVIAGLLVSDYYERMENNQLLSEKDPEEVKTKNIPIYLNEQLKKKIFESSEKHMIPASGLVSMSILTADNLIMPIYEETEEREKFSTRIPVYLWKQLKKEADNRNISDNFYIEMCLYKAFLKEEGLFY